MTKRMKRLDRTASLPIHSQDEIGVLKQQINDLYHHLLEVIYNLEQQKQAAEVEVAKPFAQEEELAEKSARLAELNALLNIDRDRSSSQDAPEETEETEAPATRPSVLAALGEKTNQPEPVKPFKSYLDKEGR